MSSNEINSVLIETRKFDAPAEFAAKARIKPDDLEVLYKHAAEDPTGFWAAQARYHINWHKPFDTTLDDSNAPLYKWFTGGEMNVSWNCIDKHLETHADKTAIIFEGEQGDTRHTSYQQLHDEVCQLANGLKARGICKGDRVIIYMPMLAEAVIAMQACAYNVADAPLVGGTTHHASSRRPSPQDRACKT